MTVRSESVAVASAVVVAAGRGDRFGSPDKILLPLADRPLLAHVLETAQAASTIVEVVVVVAPHTRAAVETLVARGSWSKVRAIVDGGSRRQDSVANGVAGTSGLFPIVLIHDAARPLATAELFERCVLAAMEHGAAIAAVPVSDTIKRVDGGLVRGTVPRQDLWSAQTPQAFRRDALVAALAGTIATDSTFTDEAGLFESLGRPVAIVLGEPTNLKITTPGDLDLVRAILNTRSGTDVAAGDSQVADG
jgi:2-C-methyl-D-erythritol 4-phosphate cytidylyltransferase